MKILGFISVTMSVLMAVYLIWALFFNPEPNSGSNPFSAILLTMMFFVVGMKWIRGEKVEG